MRSHWVSKSLVLRFSMACLGWDWSNPAQPTWGHRVLSLICGDNHPFLQKDALSLRKVLADNLKTQIMSFVWNCAAVWDVLAKRTGFFLSMRFCLTSRLGPAFRSLLQLGHLQGTTPERKLNLIQGGMPGYQQNIIQGVAKHISQRH